MESTSNYGYEDKKNESIFHSSKEGLNRDNQSESNRSSSSNDSSDTDT